MDTSLTEWLTGWGQAEYTSLGEWIVGPALTEACGWHSRVQGEQVHRSDGEVAGVCAHGVCVSGCASATNMSPAIRFFHALLQPPDFFRP